MEKIAVYIILNLPMILIIQKHYCINLQKGIGVKWKLTATATVLKTDPQRNTQEYKRNMWDVGERSYHLSKTICHKSYLSLMNLKFSLTELEKIWALPHDYDDSEERYPVMYLQDAQNLFNEDAEYGNWEIDKSWR
jgi:enterochelin esterase-like enzyme